MIQWFEQHRIFAVILTILIALEIFIFSSIQFEAGEGVIGTSKTAILYHFTVFFLFSFFLFISVKGKNKMGLNYLLITLIISFIYAILDEVHQLSVQGRFFSILDIFTNVMGILSSNILYLHVNKR